MHKLDALKTKVSSMRDIQIKTHEHAASIQDLLGFKCDFKDGQCIRARAQKGKGDTFVEAGCCCTKCYENFGYLQFIPESEMETYKLCWGPLGFFEPGKGCRLPKRLRSGMCLKFVCRWAHLDSRDQYILDHLSNLFYR
jgi:hypothetical protein